MDRVPILESRWLRIALIAGTILATVATSQPAGWRVRDESPVRSTTLASGATLEVRARYEASHPVVASVHFVKFTTARTQLSIERGTQCPEGASGETIELQDGRWRNVSSTAGFDEAPSEHRFAATCGTREGRTLAGEASLRVTNVGTTPIGFEWDVEAEIHGDDGDEVAPDGAFVRVELVP